MIFSLKNLCVAGLYVCASFGVNTVDALSPIRCGGLGNYGSSFLQVLGNCSAVAAELNKVDGIDGVKCLSWDDEQRGYLVTTGWVSENEQCPAAAGALNSFGIAGVECVGYNILFHSDSSLMRC